MTAQIMARPRPTTAVPGDAERRLGAHLLDVVRRQDAAVHAARRVPRTAGEMRARQRAALGQTACGSCQGSGGKTESTTSGGVTREHWVRCNSCNGTGAA
jgi:DnaJ-class molecular chaperone